LLAFRHFVRHAYAVDLDETELRDHGVRVVRVHPGVKADMEVFAREVRRWIAGLEPRN
jgi:hypothetical protein